MIDFGRSQRPSDQDFERARTGITPLLQPDEKVELVDFFYFDTTRQIVTSWLISSVLLTAVVALLVLLAPSWLPPGTEGQAILGALVFTLVTVDTMYIFMTLMRHRRMLLVLTDQRIIIAIPPWEDTRANSDWMKAFVWQLKPKDIANIERIAGTPTTSVTRLNLSNDRSMMAHVRKIDLNASTQTDELVNRLQKRGIPMKSTALTERR